MVMLSRKTLTASHGAVGPRNLVAPAIDADAVIGVEIAGDDGSWDPLPDSYTYQWQRYTDGVWVDIEDATNKEYSAGDTDFGLALRLAVTATFEVAHQTVYSNLTALVAEVPTQSLDVELVVNGNMETGDPPNNWSPNGDGAQTSAVVDERPGGVGEKSLALVRGGSYNWPRATQTISVTEGGMVYFSGWVRNVDATRAYFSVRDTAIKSTPGQVNSSWDQRSDLSQCTGQTKQVWCEMNGTSPGVSARFDDVSLKHLVLNSQLTAPSSDMLITQYYTLPETPVAGDALWLIFRADHFAAGNYWLVELIYTGAQWDIKLDSVSTYIRTNQVSVTNVGATNGLRINASGDSIQIETTDDGISWASRSTEVINELYSTATGVNTVSTPAFVMGRLSFANAYTAPTYAGPDWYVAP